MPVFVLGLFMQWFFGLKLDLLPITRRRRQRALGDPRRRAEPGDAHHAGDHAGAHRGRVHLVHAARLDARGDPHATTSARPAPRASARRTSSRKHAFKNAVIPVMTIAGIDLGALMGGAIVTETVFASPRHRLMIYEAHRRRATCRWSPAACCSPRSSTCSPTCSSTSATPLVDPRIRLRGLSVAGTDDRRPARPGQHRASSRTSTRSRCRQRRRPTGASRRAVDRGAAAAGDAKPLGPVGRHLAAPQAKQARRRRPRHHHRLPRRGHHVQMIAYPLPRAATSRRTTRTPSTTTSRPAASARRRRCAHPMGTDYLGRDILSRVLVATRISLLVGVVAVAIALAIGLVARACLGVLRGRGRQRSSCARADIFFAYPYILVRAAHHDRAGSRLRQRVPRHRPAQVGDLRPSQPRARC